MSVGTYITYIIGLARMNLDTPHIFLRKVRQDIAVPFYWIRQSGSFIES